MLGINNVVAAEAVRGVWRIGKHIGSTRRAPCIIAYNKTLAKEYSMRYI